MHNLISLFHHHAINHRLSTFKRSLFLRAIWALLLLLVIWSTNPVNTTQAQSACLVECRGGLAQCLQNGSPNCQDSYDNCVDGCLMANMRVR